MSSKDTQISLVRVLIALAWADGEVSHEEINFLKDFMFKFDFTGEDWARIEMYMEDPVPPAEAEALITDFVRRIRSGKEKRAVISAMETLMAADGGISPEERRFLERFTEVLNNPLPGSSLFAQVRGLFKQTVFNPVGESKRSEELHDFLNNRILFKVRRRLEREKLSLETDPDGLAYASLFGGLLGHVASLHKPMDGMALTVLSRRLRETAGFDEEAVELVCSVVQEAASRGLDRFRLCREFYEKSSEDQRLRLLDCLFEIAGSDSDLANAEVEEVRAIAHGLKLTHREFIGAKTRYLHARKSADREA